MPNEGHIHIAAETRVKKEWHTHRCPWCKRFRADQPNEICQKTLHGTGLDFHVFPCVGCIQDVRARFGSDVMVDLYLSATQMAHFHLMWPSRSVDEREKRESRHDPEIRRVITEKEKL